jgi:hypothetical protein
MPEDSTRRLLRAFGIAVTDCEDALAELEASLRAAGAGAVPAAPLDAFDRAAREVDARWAEVEHLIGGHRARAREALLSSVKARGVA